MEPFVGLVVAALLIGQHFRFRSLVAAGAAQVLAITVGPPLERREP